MTYAFNCLIQGRLRRRVLCAEEAVHLIGLPVESAREALVLLIFSSVRTAFCLAPVLLVPVVLDEIDWLESGVNPTPKAWDDAGKATELFSNGAAEMVGDGNKGWRLPG